MPSDQESWRRRFVNDTFQFPDTVLAREALALAYESSPAYLLHHSIRSYAFALQLAALREQDVDREQVFLGTVLHDVGLTEAFANEHPFEVRGGSVARKFLTERGYDAQRAGHIAEAISNHLDEQIEQRAPEIALVRLGSGVDVVGVAVDQISYATMQRILAAWPRSNFKHCFSEALQLEAERVPDSAIANLVEAGLLNAIEATPFDE